jgi:hypothetical protein
MRTTAEGREMKTEATGKAANAGKRDVRTPPRHADMRIPSYRNPSESGSRSLIHRRAVRWQGLEEASRMAQIVVLEHGGHARPVINRGQQHLRSRMGSRKTGHQQVVEGRGHRDLAMWNEVNPDVIDYQAHPFLIRGQAGDEWFDYYPDHIRLMRDGRIELIEVKRTPADVDDLAYRRKLGMVAEIARRGGWTFRILYHADIAGPRWRMRNVEGIYANRYLLLDRQEQDVINAFVMRGTTTVWSTLRHLVAPSDQRRGNAVIENAIALGRVGVELDQRITCGTVLTPLPPVPHNDQIRL